MNIKFINESVNYRLIDVAVNVFHELYSINKPMNNKDIKTVAESTADFIGLNSTMEPGTMEPDSDILISSLSDIVRYLTIEGLNPNEDYDVDEFKRNLKNAILELPTLTKTDLISGTWNNDDIYTNYRDLHKIFGEPNIKGVEKTTNMWGFKMTFGKFLPTPKTTKLSIYDRNATHENISPVQYEHYGIGADMTLLPLGHIYKFYVRKGLITSSIFE